MAIVKAEIRPLERIPCNEEGMEQRAIRIGGGSLPLFVIDASQPATKLSAHGDHIRRMERLNNIFDKLAGRPVECHDSRLEYGASLGFHYDVPEQYGTEYCYNHTRLNTVASGRAWLLGGTMNPAFVRGISELPITGNKRRQYALNVMEEARKRLLEHEEIDEKLFEPLFFEGEIGLGDSVCFRARDCARMNPSCHSFETIGSEERSYFLSIFEFSNDTVVRLAELDTALLQ